MNPHRRTQAEGLAREDAQPQTSLVMGRQIMARMMREVRRRLFLAIGERDPRLDRMDGSALAPRPFESLRVRDAAAGGHPVDFARTNRLLHRKQVSDG
jgi:hypothetical protein